MNSNADKPAHFSSSSATPSNGVRFDVATTQTRAISALAFVAFAVSSWFATSRDVRFPEEPNPSNALSSAELERAAAPQALKNAVAALAADRKIVETSAQVASVPPNAPRKTLGFLVDLNSASKSELRNLPRVGDELADRIIAYRDANGGFESVDELVEIKGIGEKTLDKLRPFCVAEPRAPAP